MATRVLLIRHAQSAWNASGRWQGWADPPLSPDGEVAAAAAGAHAALSSVDAIASSDLQRARRTAEIIGGVCGVGPVHVYRGLRERGAGHWTGLTRAEIEFAWPGAFDGPVVDIPGGESAASVTARAVATLHRIADEWPGGEVLAVSHGALIRLVEQHARSAPVPIRNLTGCWVEVGPTITLGERVSLHDVLEQAG